MLSFKAPALKDFKFSIFHKMEPQHCLDLVYYDVTEILQSAAGTGVSASDLFAATADKYIHLNSSEAIFLHHSVVFWLRR